MRASRRRFLAVTGAAAASSLGGLVGVNAAAAQEAGEPALPARFRVSCCAYSFRDMLTAKPPTMDLLGFLEYAAEIDLDAVELTSYYFPADTDDTFLAKLKRRCHVLGLDISGGAVGNSFCVPPGPERAKQIDGVRVWIRRYERLGAPVMRVFAGNAPEGHSEEEARGWVAECVHECLPEAAAAGIIMALENHGGVTAGADGVLDVIRRVESEWFGANLDTGNFHSADPYDDMRKVAPLAVNVHGKQRGDAVTDYARVKAILSDVGYRGYISVEYEGTGPPKEGVAIEAKRIREA